MSIYNRGNNFAIRLTNVSKRYTIHHEKPTLVEHLIKRRNEEFWALKDINLEIKKGEKVGIIGPNGTGNRHCLIHIGQTTDTTRFCLIDSSGNSHYHFIKEQKCLLY